MSPAAAQSLNHLHEKINYCLQDISELFIRQQELGQVAKLKDQLFKAMEEHFLLEADLMAELPKELRDAHIADHQKIWSRTKEILRKDSIEINDYFELQYTYAKHEIEFDIELWPDIDHQIQPSH